MMTIDLVTRILPVKGKDHVTRRLSYHNNQYVKNSSLEQSKPLRGNGAAYELDRWQTKERKIEDEWQKR